MPIRLPPTPLSNSLADASRVGGAKERREEVGGWEGEGREGKEEKRR